MTDIVEEAVAVPAEPRWFVRGATWALSMRLVLACAIGSRVVVIASAHLLHRLHRPQGYFPVQYDAFDSTYHVLGAWDGEWYRRIALHGYSFNPNAQSDTAFFPLYPLVLRLGHVLGYDRMHFGIVVSNVCFVIGAVAFAELGRELFDEDTGRRAAIWLCVFPLGFVFSMEYPSSLVFAAMVLAVLAALRNHWLVAAVLVGLASLARPEGAVLVIPLAALAWQRRAEIPRWRAVVALLAGPAAIASFPLYLWIRLDNIRAWSDSQREWGREFQPLGLVHALTRFADQRDLHPWLLRDLAFLVVYAVLLLLGRRAGIGWPWIVAAALLVVVPLTSGTVESVARFGMLGFAFYWALARVVRSPWLEGALVAAFVALNVWWVLALPLANP